MPWKARPESDPWAESEGADPDRASPVLLALAVAAVLLVALVIGLLVLVAVTR